ncbi:DNA translocase FtsK [Shimazuella sp. AN120528]|uniref:FtsK/SpoIIIE family DNA translocase n=1 Tax=Shimazuella soli TaxID=1892854 RepID=UPI001F109916|nr:DNA translocase FtsK [Shimazuella soli]MCH5586438.1 DNA translocase FtsK [Shimazuella soli]
MAKKATKPISTPRTEKFKRELLFEIYGITILALSIIAMASLGAIGRNLTYLARFFVGSYDFLIPLIGVGLGFYVMLKRRWPNDWSPRMTGIVIVLLSLLAFSHYFTFQLLIAQGFHGSIIDKTWNLLLAERESRLPTDVGGGMIGGVIFALFYFLFESIGTVVALCALFLCGFLLVTGFSYVKFFHHISKFWDGKKAAWKTKLATFFASYYKKEQNVKNKRRRKVTSIGSVTKDPIIEEKEEIKPTIFDFEESALNKAPVEEPREQLTLKMGTKQESLKPVKEEEHVEVPFQMESSNEHYQLPPINILAQQKKTPIADKHDLNKNAEKLVHTLESFGVSARVIHIHRGPAVTRYEIQPQVGVKVSRIVNLADDLALVLAAKDIRIEAPIPGKSAIGIEVPNTEVAMVGLRDIIESDEYQKSDSKLTISLGRDISGDPNVAVLSKMPHLLVAGATGSGKSVCINGIIVSLLYKAKPDEVKLMMIDPKMVELNIYNGIPHLLAPVVTDPRRAAIALKKVVKEMEKRYEMFANIGARDIERYNTLVAQEKNGQPKLPYIVVIVDELADLMMVAPGDVEDAICRLAQMARAAGIHLIIATQRPSVDVITGVIKANIPSRIAFAVSAQTDSRTILDMGGAEKLLGRGDMLYLPVGAPKPVRLQGTYLSDEEVEQVVSFVKGQQEAKYVQEMIPTSTEGQQIDDPQDDLYLEAVQLVVEAKTASVSLLQRRLRVGYSRAARLIDTMEQNGIVGPYEGSKPREVRLSLEEWKQQQNGNANSKTEQIN